MLGFIMQTSTHLASCRRSGINGERTVGAAASA